MDKHYENIAKLYLRLKGFLVSNLIIHSEDEGNSRSEIDLVGVRMPFHLQEYRWVEVPDFLECSSERIEIIIADVKNTANPNKVRFNDGLRKDKLSVVQLVDWLGVSKENTDIINKFKEYLNLHSVVSDGFSSFTENLSIGNFTFKFTFFCPSLPEWNGKGYKYVHGEEMIDFIFECLNDLKKIETCSRKYDYKNWNEFEKYVRFFKEAKSKVTHEDFEIYCNTLK